MNSKKIQTEICYPEDLPEEIRSGLENADGHVFRTNGRIYLALKDIIFCCNDDYDGSELIRNLRAGRPGKEMPPKDKADLYLRILQDPQFAPDERLLRTLRADPLCGGSVVVYSTAGNSDRDLGSIMSQMVPLEKEDMILPVDYHTAVFIRTEKNPGSDDLRDYTEAVIGSMESEGITGIRAGIGRHYNRPEDLRRSYREAKKALSTGIRYHEKDSVFEYGKQALERILDSIPEDRLSDIRADYRQDGAETGLSEEMIETVRVFFRNDLNLTAAARELFIHRNTLNYRLDKIRRETGLDLRSFRDAVIFRILYGIREQK